MRLNVLGPMQRAPSNDYGSHIDIASLHDSVRAEDPSRVIPAMTWPNPTTEVDLKYTLPQGHVGGFIGTVT